MDAALPSSNANQTWVDSYLDSLLTQRKLSQHTITAYRRDLAKLTKFSELTNLAAITHFQIRQFASKLHASGIGPRSIARTLSAWRNFFLWLSQTTSLASNPVDGIKAPKQARALPKALSADDAVLLVSTSPANSRTLRPIDDATQLCNRAMFELLYSCGLRVTELTTLDIHYVAQTGYISTSWITPDEQEVTVTGKGNKKRSIPVGQHALDAIAAWIAVRPRLASSSSADDLFALFLSQRGTRISPRSIQLRLKAHAQAIGLPVNVHPHVLRHSFASHVLQSSGDLRAVQEMLGHSSIASTQVYTSLDFQRLAQVYDSAHPRARTKKDTPEGDS